MDGLDALLATVQMPSGIPVARLLWAAPKTPQCWRLRFWRSPTMPLPQKLDADRVDMAAQIAVKEAKLQSELV